MQKKIILFSLILAMLSACSTAGGIYNSGDSKHGEFSVKRTIGAVLGAAAVVYAAKHSGGGGYAPKQAEEGYAWDYQPANRQWVCRDKSNGQYAKAYHCNGKVKSDTTWPG